MFYLIVCIQEFEEILWIKSLLEEKTADKITKNILEKNLHKTVVWLESFALWVGWVWNCLTQHFMDIRQKELGHRVSESWNGQAGAAECKRKTKQYPYIASPTIKQFEVWEAKIKEGVATETVGCFYSVCSIWESHGR